MDFEMTGLKDGKKEQQLRNFTYSLRDAQKSHTLPEVPKDWLAAFYELKQHLESLNTKKKKVVFIDELPWVATAKSDFLTGFSYFWNSYASKHNIVVIICGSATAWMIQKIINNKGGLHNRVTRRILLHPFTLAETEAYFKSRKIRLDRYQLLLLYMTMGGIPHYLDQVENGKSKTKLKDGGGFTKMLKELEQSGFITSYTPFGKKKKDRLYRLTDNYSLFYLKYIRDIPPNESGNWKELSQTQSWKSWSGYAFENICLQHIDAIKKALSIGGMHTRHRSFLVKATNTHEGAQIDLLIDRNDNAISLCEVKFYNDEWALTKEEADKLRQKRRVLQEVTKTKKQIFMVLISTFNLTPNQHSIGLIDNVINMDDLFV